ncbi:MAG: hypothetical protein H0T73_18965 [Ardenticatenales bacterium]|nr:hypothetical protein [Ardenticatenales bacterium]
MSESKRISEVEGNGWSFTYNMCHAPDYVLLTTHGQTTIERIKRLLEVIVANRPLTRLSTGHICPIIVDLNEDTAPSAAVLRGTYDAIDRIIPQLSYVVFVLVPDHPDGTRMQMWLEALGVSVAPNLIVVSSLAHALEKVRVYHRWRSSH